MFAFFPYLKTSEPINYRSVTVRASEDSTGLPADAVPDLERLRAIFFLRDHQQIRSMSYAFCVDTAAGFVVAEFLRDISELRELLAYLYSSPHDSSGEPFLRNEHSSLYVLRPKRLFRSLIENEHNVQAAQPAEYPKADDRYEIPGYECEVDGRSMTWVTTGSRLYPPCIRFWLNISQDLSWDFQQFAQSTRYHPVLAFFASRRDEPSELYARLLTALRWYNLSIGADVRDDAALVHLATAFESLLGLEQGPDITRRFKSAVMLLIGNVPRADAWLDQFYRARSEIVHRGQANALRFNPYHGMKEVATNAESGYRSLTSYGWFIFQICAAAVSSGALLASQVGLESMLLTNRQRLERISRVLSSKEPAATRMGAVTKDVSDIRRFQFVGEPGLKIDYLVGAAKLLARCYLEAFPDESAMRKELQDLADAKTSETFDALHKVRVLDDKIEKSSWTSGAMPGDPRLTVATLLQSVWHYTFMTYFHLEQHPESAGATDGSCDGDVLA